MRFLVISQRAIPNSNYKLNNLAGHGRFDVIMRCILASQTPLGSQSGTAFIYLKGSELPEHHGSLSFPHLIDTNDDEISLAHKIKTQWDDCFQRTTLKSVLDTLSPAQIFFLTEQGREYEHIRSDLAIANSLVILGAQRDLQDDDLETINEFIKTHNISVMELRIGPQSLLASQTITLFRQLSL